MADEARYNIIFRGELVSGADPDQVRRNLAQLFKMELERVEKLFTGKPVVLKKEADQATAMKMRATLKKAGAECEMKPLGGEETPAQPQSPAPESSQGTPPAPEAQASDSEATVKEAQPEETSASSGAGVSMEDKPQNLETVGTIRTGGTGFSSEFEVAPVGAELEQADSDEEPVNPDISHLSLAPPGTELEQLQDQEEVEVPDISHLKVVDE